MIFIDKPIQIHTDKHFVLALSGDATQDDEGGPKGNELLGCWTASLRTSELPRFCIPNESHDVRRSVH